MSEYKILEKGSVIGYDWYFVVVQIIITDGTFMVGCICDNANNIYSFSIDEILKETQPHPWIVMSAQKAIRVANWGECLDHEDEIIRQKIKRPIPVEVIAEVLAGVHDHRF